MGVVLIKGHGLLISGLSHRQGNIFLIKNDKFLTLNNNQQQQQLEQQKQRKTGIKTPWVTMCLLILPGRTVNILYTGIMPSL